MNLKQMSHQFRIFNRQGHTHSAVYTVAAKKMCSSIVCGSESHGMTTPRILPAPSNVNTTQILNQIEANHVAVVMPRIDATRCAQKHVSDDQRYYLMS